MYPLRLFLRGQPSIRGQSVNLILFGRNSKRNTMKKSRPLLAVFSNIIQLQILSQPQHGV